MNKLLYLHTQPLVILIKALDCWIEFPNLDIDTLMNYTKYSERELITCPTYLRKLLDSSRDVVKCPFQVETTGVKTYFTVVFS